jgi:ribose transport system substrate-binding protein
MARRATVLLPLLLAALTACSGQKASVVPKVGFIVANSQLNFATEMANGFRAGVQDVGGVEDVVDGPPIVDGPRQLQMFEQMKQDAADGISVFTLSPDLFAGPLAEAAADGIPIIAVDNQPPPSSNITLFVGNDNYQLGQMLADEIVAQVPASAKGKIVLGNNSPGVPVLDQRAKGIRDRLQSKLPNVTVSGPFDTKQDVMANLAAWRTLVRANPGALAFLGTGDADGWNLAQIRRSTRAKWLAGAFDLDPKALAAVKDGDLVLVSPEHYIKGDIAGRLQAQHAKDGTPLPAGWIYTPGLAVTKANVDSVTARQKSLEARRAYFTPLVTRILADPSSLRPLDQAR